MKTAAIVLPLALVGTLLVAPSAFARDRHVNLDFHVGFPVVVSPYYAGHGHGHHGHHHGHHGHGHYGHGYHSGYGYDDEYEDDEDVHYHNGYACRLKHARLYKKKAKHD